MNGTSTSSLLEFVLVTMHGPAVRSSAASSASFAARYEVLRLEPSVMDETWSRTDQKRANRVKEEALARLSDELAALGETKLAELELAEELLDAILGAKRITSAPARNRQMRRVRALLRDEDFAAIRARVTALREGGRASSVASDDAARREATWLLRLLGEGGPGLDAFLREFPHADRTHLRQLIQNVNKATHERRVKAEAKLRGAVRGFVR
jgi:ribosome-associated protein